MLSNFITLTDWKQPIKLVVLMTNGCELLSNFITLTDWKQPHQRCDDAEERCELLSNFITLTDWKQHNLDKELSHNYLDYVSRIKKSDSDIGFFVYI